MNPNYKLKPTFDVNTMDSYDNITDIFDSLLRHFDSVDIADAEFHKMIHEDPELKARYREWCATRGSSVKRGFLDYIEEYLSSQDSVWESLTDYDE